MNKLEWYLKQLFPFQYKSEYREGEKGQKFLTIWRMWFGRCYRVKSWELAE